ncbi:helix-turn-helix transcriptional regulator [Adhaeribacter pallidiroseus]|uniref:Putative HTH-type transcriptional regulator n=1 Tax=Adhaeribacter pallidiroseus TaxID=2072847 RepID=A0A369QKI5_9BACT|nr:helix-turn-helix transcriptional regulator [Adhaeribacter pallidiroseus]RDC63736.1 putative HTH-type transcriptional regulator [Adhaeribacter pallidiroseus]
MKIAALHVQPFLEYAQIRGVWLPPELKPVLKITPTDVLLISEPEFYGALKWIQQELPDDLWGIKTGNFVALKLLGLIYRISLQVTTLAEAFHYLQSYLQSTLPLVTTTTRITEEQITISVDIANKEKTINRIILENVLTIISREIGMMATQEVAFALTSPFWHAGYPKGWENGENFSIAFELILLKAAIKQRPAEKLEILVPEYIKLIEKIKAAEDSFANQVKILILSMSDPHLPDITAVSDALYLTPRSLQRRLERENSSFRLLQLDLKKQICSFLLQHQAYSVASMAYLLGYAEPAAFIHSFKKWFGDSPARIRKSYSNINA